jgi:translation elongation factor EF-G
MKTIPTATLLDSNNNNGNNKRVTINFTNAQDLLAVAPLTRITPTLTTTDGSSSSSNIPMITIHIIPEVAQALLGSTSVDRAKLAELLQQAHVNNSSSTATTSDSMTTNTSNSTS